MKFCVASLITFMCFANCSSQRTGSGLGANSTSTVQSSNVGAEDNGTDTTGAAMNGQPSPRTKPDNFSVDGFIDNELVSRSIYRNGLCVRYITFNAQTKKQVSDVEYLYKENGQLDHIKVRQGDDSEDAALEADKSNRDLLFQSDLLKSKAIEFPLPDIAADEVRDIASILAVTNNYSDFKTETQNAGNRKTIKFIGFSKSIRFQPSAITLVAGNNPILIKDFELTLEGHFPTKESLRTDDGELTKTYSYENGKLIGVVYQFTDLGNRTNSLKKRFEYHEVK